MTLSTDQKKAKEQFCEFLSDDNRVFILKGYAGTGKTTMAREMIHYRQPLSLCMPQAAIDYLNGRK